MEEIFAEVDFLKESRWLYDGLGIGCRDGVPSLPGSIVTDRGEATMDLKKYWPGDLGTWSWHVTNQGRTKSRREHEKTCTRLPHTTGLRRSRSRPAVREPRLWSSANSFFDEKSFVLFTRILGLLWHYLKKILIIRILMRVRKIERLFHGLVVPHWVKWRGSAGQTPCPCSTCSTESEDPLVLIPLVPRSSGDPLLPVPLVPTCANLCHLCHLVVPLEPLPTFFSQIFFWVSQCHSIFGKTLLTENFLQNTVDSIIIGVAK